MADFAALQAAIARHDDAKLESIVAKAVGRAHAHATVALTAKLAATTPGRATLRRAARSPSYAAALSDLDDLLARLAGPSSASLSGWLRDVRQRAYEDAFAWHFDRTPDEFRAASDVVSADRIAEVRGLVLHGYELRREIAGPIERAKASLAPFLESASRPGVDLSGATDTLKAWADRARNAVLSTCRLAMSDAAVALDGLALIYATAPEHRPQDEYHPKG